MRPSVRLWLVGSVGCVWFAACDLAPPYERPGTSVPSGFKEKVELRDPVPQGWKKAEPKEDALSISWWEMYQDPDLDQLEQRVVISNQTIIAAEANYRSALALAQEAQAQLFPTVSLVPSVTREKSSAALGGIGGGLTTGGATAGTSTAGAGGTVTTGGTGGTTGGGAGGTGASGTGASGTVASVGAATRNIFAFPLEASYQIDLWGSVRNNVAANRHAAEATAAQLANAVLSTQGTLAQDYIQLRVADEQRRILEATVKDYQASLKLVRTLVGNGQDSEADIASAESQLATAMAQATDVGVARSSYEHAIAVLVGVSPAELSIPYRRMRIGLPVVPLAMPSELLERRPDIAAAERQVAESNAEIGVARAAFFPNLTLSASGGYESTTIGSLFNAPNRFWSVGPSIAQILFDGGARRAATAQARAINDSQVASYRQAVLTAFQTVEDNLAALRILAVEANQAHEATEAARRAVRLTVVLLRNGLASYVNVITEQNAFLTARETELGVELRQLVASVSLIEDLGGGWTASDLKRTELLAQHPPRNAAPVPDAGPGVANPPPLPAGEIEPDDIVKLDENE